MGVRIPIRTILNRPRNGISGLARAPSFWDLEEEMDRAVFQNLLRGLSPDQKQQLVQNPGLEENFKRS
jgi:hypothetical protein